MAFLENPTFWVAVAFVIFLAIVWVKGRAAITSGMDEKIAAIRSELDEAAKLRHEAQENLGEVRRRQSDAEKQIQAILDNARDEAAQIQKDGKARLAEITKRRKQQTLDGIEQAKARAISDIKAELTDIAVDAATQLLQDGYAARKGNDPLIKGAIAKLPEDLK